MDPRIGKQSVHWRNSHTSGRIAIDHNKVVGIEISILSSEETSSRIFKKDGISRARVHGLRVILQQESIAGVGGQDDLRDGSGPREQKRAETLDNLRM